MTPGAKVFLTRAAIGGTLGVVALFASTEAKASGGQPKQPKPGSNQPPDVIVPQPGAQSPSGGALPQPPASQGLPPLFGTPPGPVAPPSVFVPPQVQTPVTPPGVQPGTTFTLPNPLGGPPLGTFDPLTGNVFGPDGITIGTFNPNTGMFTGSNGFTVQVPGFPLGAKTNVPTPATQAAPSASPPSVLTQPAGPVVPPQVTQPSQASPASSTTTAVPADTAAMVAALLDAETRSGWNRKDPNVGVFQRARPPLTNDSKFGPGTALAAAHEIGTLPLIRFWPANGQSKDTLLANYQTGLIALANLVQSTNPAHAAQLRHSAQREQAQAFSTKGPLPALAPSDQVSLTQVA